MTGTSIVQAMQGAVSCLGIFMGLWGFTLHADCLWKVMTHRQLALKDTHCIRHAYVAVLCIATIVLAFARLNTIGYLRLGSEAAGLAYIAGMLIMTVTLGLAIWARSLTVTGHTYSSYLSGGVPPSNMKMLARILTALLIITLAFVAVGLLNLGR